MSDQDDMLEEIGRMLGAGVEGISLHDELSGQTTSFALPKHASLEGPLLGHGDPVSIGDWVEITHHWAGGEHALQDGGQPWQIAHISPGPRHAIVFRVRDGQFSCNAGAIGGSFWRIFKKVLPQDVPLYLKETLPLPAGATLSTLRQLSKRQLLTKFVDQSEVVCYVAVGDFRYTPHLLVRREMMPLLFEWEQQLGKRRPILKSVRPKFRSVNTDFETWTAGERQIAENGAIEAKKHRYSLRLFDVDDDGEALASLLEHTQTPEDLWRTQGDIEDEVE